MQYHRPVENEGIVLAFRRDQSPYPACECRCREIDPTKSYEVTIHRAYEPEKSVKMRGSALRPLKLEINECPGSVLVEYREETARK